MDDTFKGDGWKVLGKEEEKRKDLRDISVFQVCREQAEESEESHGEVRGNWRGQLRRGKSMLEGGCRPGSPAMSTWCTLRISPPRSF